MRISELRKGKLDEWDTLEYLLSITKDWRTSPKLIADTTTLLLKLRKQDSARARKLWSHYRINDIFATCDRCCRIVSEQEERRGASSCCGRGILWEEHSIERRLNREAKRKEPNWLNLPLFRWNKRRKANKV